MKNPLIQLITLPLMVVGSSHAALTAYEGFDYGFQTNLNGLAPGGGATGFTGNWTVTLAADADDDFYETRGTGENFGYGTLSETGRVIRKQNGTDNSHQFAAGSITLSNTSIFANGSSVWLGFLSNWTNGNMGISVGDSGFEAESKNNLRLLSGNGLGVFLDNNDGGGGGSLGIEAALFDQSSVGGNQSNTGVDPIAGDVLYLANFQLTSGNDVINVYQVDNTGFSTLAATYTASVDNTSFDTLSFLSGSAVNFDEFRIGTTLDDVTPGMTITGAATGVVIPEPSMFGLLGVAGGICLLRRKR